MHVYGIYFHITIVDICYRKKPVSLFIKRYRLFQQDYLPQHLAVGSVEDIAVAADFFAEGLKAVPGVVDVKFVAVAPDVEQLRGFRLHSQKLVRHFLHIRPIQMVNRGVKAQQVFLRGKAVA